jgi:hypothetical protein
VVNLAGTDRLALPALTQVGGSFVVDRSAALRSVRFPMLARVGADLNMSSLANLNDIQVTGWLSHNTTTTSPTTSIYSGTMMSGRRCLSSLRS